MRPPPHTPRRNGSVIAPIGAAQRKRRVPGWAYTVGLLFLSGIVSSPATGAPASPKASLTPLEQQAISRYQAGEYDLVLQLLQNLPPGQEPGRELVRHAILSDLKLGKPE